MKGGWGCARILDKLDYKTISQNPKVLIGFSDITTLLNVIYAKTGLITFHGPVGNSGWNDWTSTVFKSVVMNAEKTIFIFHEHVHSYSAITLCIVIGCELRN